MQQIVVDASIVVKWFIREKFSELALKVRDSFVDGQFRLISSSLLHYEVLNALKYSKLFLDSELELAATSLENYGIILVPLNGTYTQTVVKLAETYDLSIYDAAYIGLADILDVQAYSADRKLVNKVSKNYEEKFLFIKKFDRA
ncbi:MAG: type II toxin-antitoxin system VapC family toxin [Candidatus Hodarchaeales archaeon]|jgi:predicted nucleic acid-binding protein